MMVSVNAQLMRPLAGDGLASHQLTHGIGRAIAVYTKIELGYYTGRMIIANDDFLMYFHLRDRPERMEELSVSRR
jgi:hypothetical protein